MRIIFNSFRGWQGAGPSSPAHDPTKTANHVVRAEAPKFTASQPEYTQPVIQVSETGTFIKCTPSTRANQSRNAAMRSEGSDFSPQV